MSNKIKIKNQKSKAANDTVQEPVNNIDKKRETINLVISVLGAFLGVYIVILLNKNVTCQLPLPVKAIMTIAEYWIIALPVIILMIVNKESIFELGIDKKRIPLQLYLGAVMGLGLSVSLTLVPNLIGLGAYVSNDKGYTHIWQFAYEFLYCILAVGAVEELVFRGYIFNRLKNLGDNEFFGIAASSVLFGLWHIFNGEWLQVILTMLIGALFCILRRRLRLYTTLSLMVTHGVYDAMIVVWTAVFNR